MQIIGNEQNGLDLTWTITNKCNYSCEYCLIKKGNNFVDKNNIFQINKYKDKIRYLILFGGEPTLHPDIKYIIDNCKCRLKLWSNLSADIDFYNNLPNSVNLVCTYHSHIKLEEFLEKISHLKKKPDCHIPISHNFNIQAYEKIKKYTNKCETIPIIGINNYYKNNELENKVCNYETDLIIRDKNKVISINQENFSKIKLIRTVCVYCNINKYCLDLTLDNKYQICNKIFNSLDEAYNYNLICSNQNCNICFLYIGKKSGIFKLKIE